MSGLPAEVAATAASVAVSDADLVRTALGGDQDAFAALVARHQRRTFWVAFHVLGSVEDARDVAQEAFVRLFRTLASFDCDRSFTTWFHRIVLNLAIDLLRRRREVGVTGYDDLPDAESEHQDPLASLEQNERHDLVWRVLDGLDPKYRAVIVLREMHGLNCREIAPILQATHATIRWRLHVARQMFQQRWDRLVEGGAS